MKGLSFLFTAMLISGLLQAQSSRFVLKGDISGLKFPVERVYLNYQIDGQNINDSAVVQEGHFGFIGNLPGATQAALQVKYRKNPNSPVQLPFNSKRDYAILFLEPGNLTVASTDSFANITVAGSKSDIEYRKLQEKSIPFNSLLDRLYNAYTDARKRKDEPAMEQLEKEIDDANAEANDKIYGNYIKQNPESPLAMFALKNWGGYDIDPVKIEPVFNTLPLSVRNSPDGKDMQEKISIAKKTGIGQFAMPFKQSDTLGKPIALSSFKGKYLLLDFWASWCGPCRAENPNLVKAYEIYKPKGFQVLSVSLDRPGEKNKWLNAIRDDGLRWTHVSDLAFWDNAVAKLYGIQAIPQNLLLDPQGKIIAKNLRGADLQKKLALIYPD